MTTILLVCLVTVILSYLSARFGTRHTHSAIRADIAALRRGQMMNDSQIKRLMEDFIALERVMIGKESAE